MIIKKIIMPEPRSPGDYYKIQDTVNPYRQYEGLFTRAREMTPSNMLQAFVARDSINMLALGSATEKNLAAFKGFYSHLRQGNKRQSDKILLLDINQVPLDIAKGANQGVDSEKVDFVQGDIRDMKSAHVEDATQDLVVSDYTLNFMPDERGVEQAIQEISRVSKIKGAVLLRFGNNLVRSPQSTKTSFESPAKKGNQAGFEVLFLPSKLVLALTKKYSLNLESIDTEVTTEADGTARISYIFLLRKIKLKENEII